MARLFIFGIGGTGSRVIRSLTMLMASGIELPNVSEVIPIIIDPDSANGDLNRTTELIRRYARIREYADPGEGFFKQKITTLFEDYRFSLEGVHDAKFRDFIGYDQLNESTKEITSLLFSTSNLEAEMEVGFKGNPNIGSVVLNQFHNSKEFEIFTSNFHQDDRIFIISSIFGGTGAAGFPLLLKNIRNPNQTWQNHNALKNSRIGAITVLPYFGVEPDKDSQIEKATFISKTKAALSYYRRNLSGDNSLNALYYIGDEITQDYKNVQGASSQRNKAHIVEIAAALAIKDFCGIKDSDLVVNDGKAGRTVFKEFGIKENGHEKITFSLLADKTRKDLIAPMTGFYLMGVYLRNRIQETMGIRPWNNAEKPKFDESFMSSDFYGEISAFITAFFEWLDELKDNRRSFIPFQVPDKDDLSTIMTDRQPKSGSINYNSIDHYLNRRKNKPDTRSLAGKMLSLFSVAGAQLVNKEYGE
jgi:hypothetical protein